MPVYTLPTFNLATNIWRGEISQLSSEWPRTRPTRAADLTPLGQLYIQQKGGGLAFSLPYLSQSNLLSTMSVGIHLRMPAGTLVRYPLPNFIDGSGSFDLVEVPAGSGYLYVIVFVFDAHKGFSNEYRVAVLVPYARWNCPEDANRRLIDSLDIMIGANT